MFIRPCALVLAVGLLPACGGDSDGAAAGPVREIALATSDQLRFEPMSITAKPGEKVVLVVSNAGRLDHEIAIGDPAYLESHADAVDHGGHQGDGGSSAAVAAGKTVRLTFTMPTGEPPAYACYVDRHDKAGMTGTVAYA